MSSPNRWQCLRNRDSVGADASLTAATNLVIAGIGFFTGIIAARLLGPHGRGDLAAIQTTPSVIGSFAMIGMPEGLVYFSAQRPGQAGRYLGTASVIALMASIPLMIAAYLAMPVMLHAQSPGIVADARLFLLITPVFAIVGTMYHPLRGTGDFTSWNLLRLAVPILALLVLGLATLSDRITPRFIAFGNLATYVILFFPCFWVVRRRLPGSYLPDRTKVRPMLRFGLPCMMAGLPQILNLRLDQLLMGALLPASALGLYVVAVAWSGAVLPLLTSVGSILLPLIASSTDANRSMALMGEGVRMTLMLAIIVSGAVALVTPIAIPFLFGARFHSAVTAAIILVPAAGVLGVNFTLQESIRGLGCPSAVLQAELVGLVVSILSLAVLLPLFGIVGAAIASAIGYSTVMFALLISARRLAGISIYKLLLPRSAEMKRGLMLIVAIARELTARKQFHPLQ